MLFERIEVGQGSLHVIQLLRFKTLDLAATKCMEKPNLCKPILKIGLRSTHTKSKNKGGTEAAEGCRILGFRANVSGKWEFHGIFQTFPYSPCSLSSAAR